MIGKSLRKYNFPKTGIGDQKEKKKKKRENSTKIWKSRCEDRKVYTPMTGSPAFCSFQNNIYSLDGGTRGWVIPEDRPLDTDM